MTEAQSSTGDARVAPRERRLIFERHPRLVPITLFLAVFVIHVVSPTPQSGDSRLSAITAWQFFRELNLHLENYDVVQALASRADIVEYNGHWLPFFPWPTMLLAAPMDFLLSLVGHAPTTLSISDPTRVWLVEIPTASAMVALTTVLVWSIVMNLPSAWATGRVALITALFFAFGTSAWSVGSRALWQQTASMLLLTFMVFTLQRLEPTRRWWWWVLLFGVGSGLAVVCRPTNVIPVAALWLLFAFRRPRGLPLAFLGAAVPLVPFLLISQAQYGAALPPYYLPSRLDEPGFPFWDSLWMNLISPNRGLLIFDPVAVLAILGAIMSWRLRVFTGLHAALLAACVGHILVIAFYGSTGGSTFGPRLLMDVLSYLVLLATPAFALLVKPLRTRSTWTKVGAVGVAVIMTWSLFVNATGGLLRSAFCWSATPVQVDASPGRVWDWSDMQVLRPYRDLAAGTSIPTVVAGSCTSPR